VGRQRYRLSSSFPPWQSPCGLAALARAVGGRSFRTRGKLFFYGAPYAFSIASATISWRSAHSVGLTADRRRDQAMHVTRGRLVNEIAERRRADAELVKAHDLLATTVASIGDAVVITNETATSLS
jgi:hypothetical protein